MAERAVFIVEFASGQGAVAVAHVPEVAGYDRLVLQWTGAADFQVHARAFNTHGGTQTHVWSGSAHLEGAETGPTTSGDVLRLGKARVLAPRRAEIYSVPTGGLTESGSTRLTVESRVTSETCGRDIALQSLIQRGKMRPRSRFVDVRMPDCTTVGGFMVLKNLFDDLMIARR
ncbi:hypothetical protein ACFMPD_01100 [Sedimentitalea sp. HM32M-2]|uniref:hypothetical protein n=1 Tax=Sedimentitalea sp. HM32M-2 TaxID=3351566 RepID=UPI003641C155